MDGETGNGAQQALEAVQRQRAELARRIRMPRWYLALSAAALLSLFAAPSLITNAGHHPSGALVPAVMLPALAVLGVRDVVIRRAAGARLPVNAVRAFPSARLATLAGFSTLAAGSTATWVAALNMSRLAALACGLACCAAVIATQLWTLEAIQSDIQTGRGPAR